MPSTRTLKFVHITSTAWFLLSGVFLAIIALRQAGMQWWLIFSLSGYSGGLIFFLVLVYIFAIYRGVARSQKIVTEHPLTCSTGYMTFYDISPFLGAIAAMTAFPETSNAIERTVSIATGSLTSTFMVWVVLDPAISLVEMLLPESRFHRKKRISETKELQKRIKEDNERLLADIIEKEKINHEQRYIELIPMARELAELIADHKIGCKNIEAQAIEIGARAWSLGGMSCMRQLHEMAMDAYLEKYDEPFMVDHIGIWWDGIGHWQKPAITKKLTRTS